MSGARLFVVDDDELALEAQASVLIAAGHSVTTFGSGDAALHAAAQSPPDAMLVDIVMGDMDGVELCRQMRNNPATARVALIAVTQLTDADYWRRRLSEVGAAGLVRKPIDRAAVAEIERLIGFRR